MRKTHEEEKLFENNRQPWTSTLHKFKEELKTISQVQNPWDKSECVNGRENK